MRYMRFFLIFLLIESEALTITVAEEEKWVPWIPTPDAVELVHKTAGTRSLITVDIEDTVCSRIDSWGEIARIGNEFSVDAQMSIWTGACILIIVLISHTYDLGELPPGSYNFEFRAWGQPVERLSFSIPALCTVSIETVQRVNKGDTFSVAVNIKDATNLAGFQLDIAFNPSILGAVGVEEGPFLSSSGGTYWLKPSIDNTKGVIRGIVCAKTGKGGVDGSGILATITFKAIGAGESYIRLQNVILSDPNGGSIPVKLVDGSITVIEFPAWDVNNDGIVNIADLVLVGQHFGEAITTPMDPNPDVNGDGTVNIFDLVLVCQHFGETYLPAAPSRDIWSFDAKYLPVLVKMYNIMENNPSSDPGFLATKSLLHRLISSAKISKTQVFQNYPNPFNPETWIPYQLAEDSEVTIRIYSVTGQLIRHLHLGYKEAGLYVTKDASAHWDGTTDTGEHASSGVYFYNIRAGNYSASRKMIVVQ